MIIGTFLVAQQAQESLSSNQFTMWWITVGIGLVVILVVIALLSLLLKIVKDIDTGVEDLWNMATRLAANTATTWQLTNAAQSLERLRDELKQHDRLLGQQR